MRGERGFALILTLVVTALMVAVLVELIHGVYVDMSLSRGYRDGQQASLLAESGITGGTKLLQLSLLGKTVSSLSDVWATPVKLDDETGAIEISITEESGRINLNSLVLPNGQPDPFTLAALKLLGKRLQIPDDVWSCLADWQDGDDQLSSGGGAEAPYYRALKRPYDPRNGKLATLAELSLVKGFTPEIITRLAPFVTIYADQAATPLLKVNINTASKEVLAALDEGIDDRMAERILEMRRLKPFDTTYNLSNVPGGGVIASKVSPYVIYKGNLFRITSVARVKESARKVEAVMRLSGETVLWQEY